MTDDLTADDKRIRANKARTALTDLGWAFDEFEQKLKENWADSEATHAEAREVIYHRLGALRSIRDGLQSIVTEYDNDEVIRVARERTRDD
jgi:hypothetical protein